MTERGFEVSRDPSEWAFVDRLLPSSKLVPACPDPQDFPSGFRAPTARPGDHPYHVRRSRNHMLPVYTKVRHLDNLFITRINNVDGDLFALAEARLSDVGGEQTAIHKYRSRHSTQYRHPPASRIVGGAIRQLHFRK